MNIDCDSSSFDCQVTVSLWLCVSHSHFHLFVILIGLRHFSISIMSPPDSNETTALMDGDRAYQSISVQHMEDPQDELQQTSSLSSRRRSLLLVSIGMMVFVGCMLLSYDIGARSTSHGPAVEGTHLTPKAQLSIENPDVPLEPFYAFTCHTKDPCKSNKEPSDCAIPCRWNDNSEDKCCLRHFDKRLVNPIGNDDHWSILPL